MLEGEINQINLVERLVELWREQFTGAIRFESEGIIKILYFKTGDILSASTNDRADSIDEILMRAGKVSREHVKQALAKRKESETLGDALLNLGFITRKELTWARRVQVVGVIRSIAAWTEGSFTVVADYLPKRDEGTLFPVPQVLVELVVTDQDRARFERELDGGAAVFQKGSEFDEVWSSLGLNEEADAIAREIDGRKTANEIATASGGETFNVYKLLFALSLLRVLTRTQKPQVTHEFSLDDFAAAGVADAADLWAQPIETKPPVTVPSSTFELDQPMNDDVTSSEPELDFDTPEPELDFSTPEPTVDFSEQPLVGTDAGVDPEAVTDPGLSWNDEPATAQFAASDLDEQPVAPVRLPAWDAPPRQPLAVPIPGSFEPPVDAEEELGGFDEAQLETARRAAIPAAATVPPQRSDWNPPARKKSRSRKGLVIALLVIALVAATGYFATQWWQSQQVPNETIASTTSAPAATATEVGGGDVPTSTQATGTVVPLATPTTETVSTATVSPAPTETVAPVTTSVAPAPAVVTPSPAQIPPATGSARARLDAMAREYAANPRGNFTVQIQILCDPSNLEKAMRAGGESLWFVPQPIGERSCYRVFWGRFETREQAQQALSQVPAALRDRSAAVKPVPGR